MSKWREILLAVIILILLIMASMKSSAGEAATSVTAKLIDPNTGLPIGLPGVSKSAIGPALFPPGISNVAGNADTQDYAKNPSIPLCPTGYAPVIDPDTNGIYCVTPDLLNVSAA